MALLAAMQLADSFFPSGMYTQSHGLERFIELGTADEPALAALLASYLLHVAAPGDALAARWVARAAASGDLETVAAIDARLEATRLAPEARLASRRCGGRLLLLGADVFGAELAARYAALVSLAQAPGHQAVALALLAHAAGLDEEAGVLVELHSFAVSLAGAAVRLGALDHAAAQRLLRGAQPTMLEAAALGRARHWRDMGGFAPQIDLMQFQHAHAESHMFVS